VLAEGLSSRRCLRPAPAPRGSGFVGRPGRGDARRDREGGVGCLERGPFRGRTHGRLRATAQGRWWGDDDSRDSRSRTRTAACEAIPRGRRRTSLRDPAACRDSSAQAMVRPCTRSRAGLDDIGDGRPGPRAKIAALRPAEVSPASPRWRPGGPPRNGGSFRARARVPARTDCPLDALGGARRRVEADVIGDHIRGRFDALLVYCRQGRWGSIGSVSRDLHGRPRGWQMGAAAGRDLRRPRCSSRNHRDVRGGSWTVGRVYPMPAEAAAARLRGLVAVRRARMGRR